MKSRIIATQAIFLSLALIFYVIENIYLPALPIPGAKLGLANLVTIILIYMYSWKEGLFNSVARTVLGSIISGTIMAPTFVFSLAGAIVSSLIMALIIHYYQEKFSPVGVGIIGALGHNLAQLIVAIIFAGHFGLIQLLPLLIFISIFTGMITGLISSRSLIGLNHLVPKQEYQNIY